MIYNNKKVGDDMTTKFLSANAFKMHNFAFRIKTNIKMKTIFKVNL